MSELILIVTRHYAPEPTGSAPVMQELAEWLARKGYPVEVVTVRPSYPVARIMAGYSRGERDDAVENGVDVVRFATWPVSAKGGLLARVGPEARFLADLAWRRLTGRLVSSSKVISLCPSILTVIGARWLTKRSGIHIAVVHDIPSGLSAAIKPGQGAAFLWILRHVEAWAFNHVDHVVVLSDAMARQLRAIGVRSDVIVLPPHIDTHRLRPTAIPRGEIPLLMYSGNLGRKQGLDQLLDLAAYLKAESSPLRLVIRGEGPAKAGLVERVDREGLSQVSILPLVERDQVAASLAEATLHLVPQIAGGAEFAVPSKIFSIMAAGRTFVATADAESPLAELAKRSGAFMCVPPDDPAALASAIKKLLDDPSRLQSMAAAGRRLVENEVDTDVVMRRFLQLLDGGAL